MGRGISEGQKVRLREVGTRREEDEHFKCIRMDLMDLEHFVGAQMRMHVTGRFSLGQTTGNRHGSSLFSASRLSSNSFRGGSEKGGRGFVQKVRGGLSSSALDLACVSVTKTFRNSCLTCLVPGILP